MNIFCRLSSAGSRSIGMGLCSSPYFECQHLLWDSSRKIESCEFVFYTPCDRGKTNQNCDWNEIILSQGWTILTQCPENSGLCEFQIEHHNQSWDVITANTARWGISTRENDSAWDIIRTAAFLHNQQRTEWDCTEPGLWEGWEGQIRLRQRWNKCYNSGRKHNWDRTKFLLVFAFGLDLEP